MRHQYAQNRTAPSNESAAGTWKASGQPPRDTRYAVTAAAMAPRVCSSPRTGRRHRRRRPPQVTAKDTPTVSSKPNTAALKHGTLTSGSCQSVAWEWE